MKVTPMSWNAVEYLKTLHTRQLMNIRRNIFTITQHEDRHMRSERRMWINMFDKNSGCTVTMQQLKAELATREHIPNKAEAKVLRQQLAKMQRSK